VKAGLKPIALAALVFALGWTLGSRPGAAPEASPSVATTGATACEVPSSGSANRTASSAAADRLRTTASSAETATDANRAPVAPGSLDKFLLGVPFADLKRIFLERQDEEFSRTQERYGELNGLGEDELEKRMAEMHESFRQGSGGRSWFVASGEWTLRGGRKAEVEIHTNFYATRPNGQQNIGGDFADAGYAKTAHELNQFTSLYVKIDGKYASEGSGGPMFLPSMRDGMPYVLLQSYSKELTPYFDQISIPLPVLSEEGVPEIYDSVTGKWSSLPKLRWSAVDKETFDRREVEFRDARR
jgi:hypothetical protein